jgi:Spherulation-specific family 4
MIKRIFSIVITFLTIDCSIGWAIAPQSQQSNISNPNQMVILGESNHNSKLQILLPLYIYPNWYDKDKYIWKQVITAAKKVSIVAIINPNSGPNHAPPNPDYQQGIKDLHQVGVKIIGYVPTRYTKRDLQAVKDDIDLYTKHFQVDGIFIDEATNTPDKLNYYRELYQYIKSQSALYNVIINPGISVDESYISQPVADVTVIFENYQKVWTKYHPPAYTKHYSSQHFAALVHTTANRKLMKSTLDRAVKNNFGYIYITDDSTDTGNRNPWDTLPEYWQAQVNYIQQLNDAK